MRRCWESKRRRRLRGSTRGHPLLVMPWKRILLDRWPGIFERGQQPPNQSEKKVAQLHQKIGHLPVDLDWLKKSVGSWACRPTANADPSARGAEQSPSMRTAGDPSDGLPLPTPPRDRREPGADATARRVAFGASGLWEAPVGGAAAPAGPRGEPAADHAADAGHGDRSALPATTLSQPGGRSRDLPVSTEGDVEINGPDPVWCIDPSFSPCRSGRFLKVMKWA